MCLQKLLFSVKWPVYMDNYFSNLRISGNLTLLLYLQDQELFWRGVLRVTVFMETVYKAGYISKRHGYVHGNLTWN